jgi:hypothetical protein
LYKPQTHSTTFVYPQLTILIRNCKYFTYLGGVLNFNGKFAVAEKHVAEQGRKAVFALIKKF